MADPTSPSPGSRGIFLQTTLTVVVSYLCLKFGVGWLTGLLMKSGGPMPLPSVAVLIFMILVVTGAAVYVISSEERLEGFLAPILASLRGESAALRVVRAIVLVLVPLLVGWQVYVAGVPKVEAPVGLRIQHPTIPGKYEKAVNPFRDPTDEQVQAYIDGEGLEGLSLEEARPLLVEKHILEGRALYQKNCQPCHGCAANGTGPQGRGFRLKPINFTDTGTIATIVEGYAFWRVKEGWAGLPKDSTPWDSAMPVWQDDLTDDEIWKIIMAEYDIAGVEPRRPEQLERE